MENKNIHRDITTEEEASSSINGDILISILSKLPLLDLYSASQVSKSWNRAVFYSLNHLKTKPWLFLYNPKKSPPYTTTSTAYDPISNHWIKLKSTSPIKHISTVQSSHSNLLYTLTPTHFSFSLDAFHLTWRHVAPPRVWRIDPIVAVVGRWLIIAGGVNEYEDDSLSVELFDVENGVAWEPCESMPDALYGSASATWLSVAVSSSLKTMVVTEKRLGFTCFDLETRSWKNLCPLEDGNLYSRSICFVGDSRLIMAGITSDEENPKEVEFWRVEFNKFELVGSMPNECFEKMRGVDSNWPLTSIAFDAVGDMVYVCDSTSTVGDIVAAEFEGGKFCKWRSLREADANESDAVERRVVACSVVGFSDLKRAFNDNLSFVT